MSRFCRCWFIAVAFAIGDHTLVFAADAPAVPAVRVQAAPPERKTLVRATEQPARVEPFEASPLDAKLSGYVAKVLVDIGDEVREGQVLAELSVPELVEELKKKEALVGLSDAEILQAKAEVIHDEAAAATARAQLAETRAALEGAESEMQRSRSEYERMQQLAASNAVTQKLVDEAKNAFQSANAAHKEAGAKIVSAQAMVAETEAHIAKAKADEGAAESRKKVAEIELARTRVLCDYMKIRAPYAGVITARSVHPGCFVHEGGDALLRIVRADPVRVTIDVPEYEAAWTNVGDKVVLRFPALGNREIVGSITRTAWSLDATARTLRIAVDLSNGDGKLRPGMYANARIILEERPSVLVLPLSAVMTEGATSLVYRVADRKAVKTPIILGLSAGKEIEILSGMNETAVVVLSNLASVKDGVDLDIIPPVPKP